MVRIVPGQPVDGRGEALLDEALAVGHAAGYLHVVRTTARRDQLRAREREAAGVAFGGVAVRLSDFVKDIARRRTHVRARLDDAARALLLDDLARQDARPPLRGVPGLAAWLGSLFSVLKQGDTFTVDHALRAFPSLGRAGAGGAEALRLFGLYQTRLQEFALYDEDGFYLEVARDLGTPELPFDRIAPVRRRLVVEGFYQTNVVERAIFARLFRAFDETLWLVDGPARPCSGAFGSRVFDGQRIGAVDLPGDLDWLAEQGAAFPGAAGAEPALGGLWDDAVARRTTFLLAADERAEARALARRAADILREDPAAAVVIAYPSDRAAAPLLREACAEEGLPLAVGSWRTLAECGAWRALVNLLRLSAYDFERDRVVAALRGPHGHAPGDLPAAGEVDRVARAAGVVAGAAAWARRLPRLAAREPRRAAEAARVLAGVQSLVALVPPPDDRSSILDFVARVRGLSDRFGFLGGDTPPAGAFAPDEAEALAGAARTRAAIVGVLDAYERSAALLSSAPRSWRDHVDALESVAAGTAVPSTPAARAGVRLVGMREVRGLATDHLLVGGLAEDAFPGPGARAPLLDDLDAARAGAHTPEARRREAEHLLAHALRSPRKSLVLCRSRFRAGVESLPALALADVLLRARRAEEPVPVALRVRPHAANDATLAWRRVAAEAERFDPDRLGRFDGVLEEEALPLLDPGGPAIAMSASRFEDYAKCPLRFFFRRVLGVQAPDEVDPDISARDRGSIVHRILSAFHADGGHDVPRPEQDARMRAIADAELATRSPDGLYAEVFAERLRATLGAYLDFETQRDPAFRPAFFEARFGPQRATEGFETVLREDPIPLFQVAVGDRVLDVTLAGSIDRVDLSRAQDRVRAIVVDYKTGNVDDKRADVKKGLLLQLPLYGNVLPALIGPHVGGRPVEVVQIAFYQVKSPAAVTFEARIGKGHELPSLLRASLDRAREIVLAWLGGRFHATAQSSSCTFCEFAATCRGRGDEARIKAMADPRRFVQERSLVGDDDA